MEVSTLVKEMLCNIFHTRCYYHHFTKFSNPCYHNVVKIIVIYVGIHATEEHITHPKGMTSLMKEWNVLGGCTVYYD